MSTATRKPFHGGRVFTDDDAPINPKPRRSYACFADQCPQPGTLFSGDSQTGSCAWHYGAIPSTIPRITQVLHDWGCVAYECNEARRALSGELATDPKALADCFENAWDRLKPLVHGWEPQLAPGCIRDTNFRETYSDWAKRLELFLYARIKDAIGIRRPQ